jgi:hypothetical protein
MMKTIIFPCSTHAAILFVLQELNSLSDQQALDAYGFDIR